MSNTPKTLKVAVMLKDGKDIDWPHSHIPRVGENVCLALGKNYKVERVSYNALDGGGFIAVATISPVST